MKCPKCGAENPEYSVYCASCAAQLKEPAAAEKRGAPEVLPPKLPWMLSPTNTLVMAILVSVFGAIRMIEFAAGKSDWAEGVIGMLFLALAALLFFLWRRAVKGGGFEAPFRYLSAEAAPAVDVRSSSATSMNLPGIVVLAGFAVMGVGFLVLAATVGGPFPDVAWGVAMLVGLAISGMVAFVMLKARNEVTVSQEGIWFHIPLAHMTMHFKRSDLAVLEVKGRVLRVVLRDPPHGMFRQSRHILFGDARKREEFAQAVNSFNLLGPPPA